MSKPDYTAMSSGELLSELGDDAQKWAQAFLRLTNAKEVDEGTMIGWFANAMVRAKDEERWRKERAA